MTNTYHFLAYDNLRVTDPIVASLSAARAFPALNSSSYSMNAYLLGASRTSLFKSKITQVLYS